MHFERSAGSQWGTVQTVGGTVRLCETPERAQPQDNAHPGEEDLYSVQTVGGKVRICEDPERAQPQDNAHPGEGNCALYSTDDGWDSQLNRHYKDNTHLDERTIWYDDIAQGFRTRDELNMACISAG